MILATENAGKSFELDVTGKTIINYSFNFEYGPYYT